MDRVLIDTSIWMDSLLNLEYIEMSWLHWQKAADLSIKIKNTFTPANMLVTISHVPIKKNMPGKYFNTIPHYS
jgi:hypothetical protein